MALERYRYKNMDNHHSRNIPLHDDNCSIGLKDFSSKAEFLYYNNKSLTCDIITLVMGRYCIRRSEFVNKTMKIYKESGLFVLILCTFVARHSVPSKIARR